MGAFQEEFQNKLSLEMYLYTHTALRFYNGNLEWKRWDYTVCIHRIN